MGRAELNGVDGGKVELTVVDQDGVNAWERWIGLRSGRLRTLVNEEMFLAGFAEGRKAGGQGDAKNGWDAWIGQRDWMMRTAHNENLFKSGFTAAQGTKAAQQSEPEGEPAN